MGLNCEVVTWLGVTAWYILVILFSFGLSFAVADLNWEFGTAWSLAYHIGDSWGCLFWTVIIVGGGVALFVLIGWAGQTLTTRWC